MILIKCFLTVFRMIVSNLNTRNLNEGYKVRECYSCLKMVIQAHLHVDFFTIFFIKRASLLRFSSIQLGGISTFCPLGYFWALGYYHILAQKIRQEKLLKFIKILNYNKSSCIIFVLNCFKYFQIYIIHKKNKNTLVGRYH